MRWLFFLIIFSLVTVLSAQSLEEMANRKPHSIERLELSTLQANQLAIKTPFAQPVILNPDQEKLLKEKAILKIELVYTAFRTSPNFNQKQLNINRLKELKKIAPFLFDFPLWEFELISQAAGNSRTVCNEMFHGFIITYRPNSSKNTLKQEANYLNQLVNAMVKQDSLDQDTLPKKYIIKTHYDKVVGYLHDTIWFIDTVKPPSPPDFFYNHSLYNDSTVLNAFERNKDWKNYIVVTDVTGSMSPYSAQVFVWLKAQQERKNAKYFVFFNDGDDKDSQRKKPLNTKGIYVTENKGLTEVTKTASKCMNNGSGGGENMENDVEAIIEGIKYYPAADAVILIADNMEIMRDYKYIDKIKKPVHVILCGSSGRVNIQYLDLARQTKGSLHTSLSDLWDLNKYKEGEHFTIDGKEYMYKNGRFHSVYESLKYQNKTLR